MDPQLAAALLSLGLIAISALGTLIRLWLNQVQRKLEVNTALTQQTKDAADGRLGDVLARLAAERNTSTGLRVLVRELEDQQRYLVSRLPEAEQLLVTYRDRRTRRYSSAEELAAIDRFTADDIDDPTGSDAGAHRNQL